MPLDIHIDADENGLHQTAQWFGQLSQHAHDVGTDIIGARGASESGWNGQSGPAFRSFMGQFGAGVDKFRDGGTTLSQGTTAFAGAVTQAKGRMQQAKQVAQSAGLAVSDTQISEPGPAPAAPGTLPPNATPAQSQAHAAATQAQSQHQAQVRAFQEATQTVTQTRSGFQQAEKTFVDLLGGGPVQIGLKVTDVTTGLAGAAIGATEKYRDAASDLAKSAEKWAGLAEDPSLSSADRARALMNKCFDKAQSTIAAEKATGTAARNALDKLPDFAKNSLGELDNFADIGGKFGKFAMPVLRRVPVVGLGITALGIGADIASGKDPGEAAASGLGGFAAGAAVGAMVGGPVGVVAGAVVGAGVSWAIDHHKQIEHAVGEAADWAGNKLSDVGHTIGSWF